MATVHARDGLKVHTLGWQETDDVIDLAYAHDTGDTPVASAWHTIWLT